MTAQLCREIKLKCTLYQKYKRATTAATWEEFRKQRNRVCKLLKKAKSKYVQQLLEDLDEYPDQHSLGKTNRKMCIFQIYTRCYEQCWKEKVLSHTWFTTDRQDIDNHWRRQGWNIQLLLFKP